MQAAGPALAWVCAVAIPVLACASDVDADDAATKDATGSR